MRTRDIQSLETLDSAGIRYNQLMTTSLTSLLEQALSARAALVDSAHESAFRLFNGFTEGCPEIIVDVYATTAVIHNYASDPNQGAVLVDEATQFLRNSLGWLQAGVVKTRHGKTHRPQGQTARAGNEVIR